MVNPDRFPGSDLGEPQGALHPSRWSPGFPVGTRGFDDLHAALFTESCTRGRRYSAKQEIRVGMTRREG
jgi:hypothetical protein